MEKDTLFMADGTEKQVAPKNNWSYSLDELQEFVDGPIECVYSPDCNQVMIMNEEGKINNLDVNAKATDLYQTWYKRCDFIVGNVLIASVDRID